MRHLSLFFALIFVNLLFACSGGSEGPGGVANAAPEITSPASVEVGENQKEAFLSLTATDANGDPVTFALQGADAQFFTLNTVSGTLAFVRSPDFETPQDQNGDNRYELIAVARDGRGGQVTQPLLVQVTNVAFDFAILSPLTNTILELERYSRLPLAFWIEYDYPERLQILANGEIMNQDSDSGASWTGSISMANGLVDVNIFFWRGEEVIHSLVIPVRHQHMISATGNLVYDSTNDQIIIPHEQRLEALIIDAATGNSQKRYPWLGATPDITDIVWDATAGTAIYNAANLNRLNLMQNSVTPIANNFEGDLADGNRWGLVYDSLNNSIFVSARAGGTYGRLDLASGVAQQMNYSSELDSGANGHLAHDPQNNRLIFAPAAGGVEVIDLTSNTLFNAFPWPSTLPQNHFGKITFDAAQDALFLAAHTSDSIVQLDMASGEFTTLSGKNIFSANMTVRGGGPELFAPSALARDSERDLLLTTSAARLLAVDSISGDRGVLFDSAAGLGALSSGYASIWVAQDGAQALALDKKPGRFFAIDLRSGTKTLKTYNPGLDVPPGYTIASAKISGDGLYAAIVYNDRSSDRNSADDADVFPVLDVINLRTGASEFLRNNNTAHPAVHFNFSRPDNELVVLSQSPTNQNQTAIEIYDLQNPANSPTEYLLAATSNTQTLAVHRVADRLYVLERVQDIDAASASFRLSVLDSALSRQTLLTFPQVGAGIDNYIEKYSGADLNAIFDDSVIAILLPAQPPRFWHITDAAEYSLNMSTFAGRDQPQDFYTIDDFRELYYLRANAGLHICWRSNCAVLAN